MADETPATATPQQGAAGPMFSMIGQYIKDLSFENPNAPQSTLLGGNAPNFSVSINVNVKKQADDVYAVELTLNAKGERDKSVLFNVELVYGSAFRVRNVPEPQLAPLLMIECPRLMFPFARQVLANVTQQGGFPPLMLEPVDFSQIYRQNLAGLAAAQAAAKGDSSAEPGAATAPVDKPN